ncbi:unnamed protein product [Brugia timori]|uniref:Uncharacterized protein n=1 Tax=Brugia timori TaxID=42155 RepID=A0A3P7X7X1_9BILA|nr:unnamed protein product [Brugia timori]
MKRPIFRENYEIHHLHCHHRHLTHKQTVISNLHQPCVLIFQILAIALDGAFSISRQ